MAAALNAIAAAEQLLNPGDGKIEVVHGNSKHQGENEQGQPGLNDTRGFKAEQTFQRPAFLEYQRQNSVGGADSQQVQEYRDQRDQQRRYKATRTTNAVSITKMIT